MPVFPDNFGVLALHPGIVESNAFLFLSQNSGNSGLLDAYLKLHDGSTVPVYSIKNTTSFLNGSGSPGTGAGMSGDFYYDYFNHKFFGPKSSVWPAGVSISGSPDGGKDGQVFTWKGVDEKRWDYPREILKTYKNYSFGNYQFPNLNKVLSDNRGIVHSIFPDTLGRGACFRMSSGTLLIVDGQNTNPAIYEFTASGDYLRKINLSGFTDVQSIDWMYGDSFVVCERGQTSVINEISVIEIPYSISEDVDIIKNGQNWVYTIVTGIGATNYTDSEGSIFRGISGVTYNPYNDKFYFCNGRPHSGQWHLWEIDNNSFATPIQLFDLSPVQPSSTDEIGDISYNRLTGTFYIAFDATLVNIDFSGNLLETSVAPYQVGGMCFSGDSSRVFLTTRSTSPRLVIWSNSTITGFYNPLTGYIENPVGNQVQLNLCRIVNEGCAVAPNPETLFSDVNTSNDFYVFDSALNPNIFLGGQSFSANQKYRIKAYGTLNTSGALFNSRCIFKKSALEMQICPLTGVLPSGDNQAWSMECNLHFYNTGSTFTPLASHQQFVCGSSIYSSVNNMNFEDSVGNWQPMLNFFSTTGQVDMKIYSISLYKD